MPAWCAPITVMDPGLMHHPAGDVIERAWTQFITRPVTVLKDESPADHRVRSVGAVPVPGDMKVPRHADHQFGTFVCESTRKMTISGDWSPRSGLDAAFSALSQMRVGALVVGADPFFNARLD
jgi:hypothetical protein